MRSACLSVCASVHEHISATAAPIFTKFVVQNLRGRGSVLLRRRCDMLCTSVLWTTSRLVVIGRMETTSVVIPGWSLMSMNAFSFDCVTQCLFFVKEYFPVRIFRPPDIVCRRTYILPVFLLLSSFFLLFFRCLISEVAERKNQPHGRK